MKAVPFNQADTKEDNDQARADTSIIYLSICSSPSN